MDKQRLSASIAQDCYFAALKTCAQVLQLPPGNAAFMGKRVVYDKIAAYAKRFISLRGDSRGGEVSTIAAIIVNALWSTLSGDPKQITPAQVEASMVSTLVLMAGITYEDIHNEEVTP